MKHPSKWPMPAKIASLAVVLFVGLVVSIQAGKAGHPTAKWLYCDTLDWC